MVAVGIHPYATRLSQITPNQRPRSAPVYRAVRRLQAHPEQRDPPSLDTRTRRPSWFRAAQLMNDEVPRAFLQDVASAVRCWRRSLERPHQTLRRSCSPAWLVLPSFFALPGSRGYVFRSWCEGRRRRVRTSLRRQRVGSDQDSRTKKGFDGCGSKRRRAPCASTSLFDSPPGGHRSRPRTRRRSRRLSSPKTALTIGVCGTFVYV